MTDINKYQSCLYNDEVLNLYDLKYEFQNNKKETMEKYRDNLRCPGCNIAQLGINENKNGIYLSAYPRSIHRDNCEYSAKPASKKELVAFYETINPDAAQRMLERILEDRPHRLVENRNQNILNNDRDNNDVRFVLENEDGNRKYLPRISLQLRDLKTLNYLVMYYGLCNLVLLKSNWGSYYLRIFRNNDTREYLCDLNISTNVFHFLENELNFIPIAREFSLDNSRKIAVRAKIAFVAKIYKKDSYFHGNITHSKLLKIIRP